MAAVQVLMGLPFTIAAYASLLNFPLNFDRSAFLYFFKNFL